MKVLKSLASLTWVWMRLNGHKAIQKIAQEKINLKIKLRSLPEWGRRYHNYFSNEIKYKMMKGGDPRDEFVKKVHRCRYLELSDIIENAG